MKLNSIIPQKNVEPVSASKERSGSAKRKAVESVLQLMRTEHEIIKSLMFELESEYRPSVRTDIFRRLQVKLLCHVHAEDKVVFCHLSRYEEATDFVVEHQLGHRQIAEAANELSVLDGSEKSWSRLVSEFIDLVECHIVGTEDSLFELVGTYFSAEHLETLATQYRWAVYRHYRDIQGANSPALHGVR